MNNQGPFPFRTTKEAWDYFDKASRMHFIRLINQESNENPDIKEQAILLRNKDYCARLLYILNMFAYQGDDSSEFDLDWAMLIAKPLSADQARRSIKDLIGMKLMTEVENIERNIELDNRNDKSSRTVQPFDRRSAGGAGGETNHETKFNFDEI